MVKFDKVGKLDFVVTKGASELIEQARGYVSQISGNMESEIASTCNEMLFLPILSRLTTVEFFKEHKIPDDVLTYRIFVHDTILEKDYFVSLGQLPDPNAPSGPIKIIESAYIR